MEDGPAMSTSSKDFGGSIVGLVGKALRFETLVRRGVE